MTELESKTICNRRHATWPKCIKNSLNFIFKSTTICVGKENDTKQVTINDGLMNLLKNNNLKLFFIYQGAQLKQF